MNKILLIFGFIFFSFYSCSDNNSEPRIDENTKPLLKMIQGINPSNSPTTTFVYNGYKIVEASTDVLYVGKYINKYTYAGDLISKEELYVNNTINHVNEYYYENNKLKTTIFKETGGGQFPPINQEKLVYKYLSNNIVELEIYRYLSSLNKWELNSSNPKIRIYFENGNIINTESYKLDGTIITSKFYQYDNKSNIYTNIVGFDKLFFRNSFSSDFIRRLEIRDINNQNNIINSSDTEKFGYKYNSLGFPTSQYKLDWTGMPSVITKNYVYY